MIEDAELCSSHDQLDCNLLKLGSPLAKSHDIDLDFLNTPSGVRHNNTIRVTEILCDQNKSAALKLTQHRQAFLIAVVITNGFVINLNSGSTRIN